MYIKTVRGINSEVKAMIQAFVITAIVETCSRMSYHMPGN